VGIKETWVGGRAAMGRGVWGEDEEKSTLQAKSVNEPTTGVGTEAAPLLGDLLPGNSYMDLKIITVEDLSESGI